MGQIAVVHVALNREHIGGWYGHGLTGELGVILKPFRFSCFNENAPSLLRLARLPEYPDHAFYHCRGIVGAVLDGNTPDPTHGATHYHTIAKPQDVTRWPPTWAAKMIETARIGAHIFYREKPKRDIILHKLNLFINSI